MDAVDVIAVVGACVPERASYANQLAELTSRALIPASRLVGSPHPAEEAAVLASWTFPAIGAVVEAPAEVLAPDLIGSLTDDGSRTRLSAIVCIVDAAHILDDLDRDDYLPLRDLASGIAAPLVARALVTATQIEYASTIVLVNWTALPSERLTLVMALLSHLSPHARLRLHRGAGEHPEHSADSSAEQSCAGWVCLLNDDFDPHMRDQRVSALRYEQLRPLHPIRLLQALDDISSGAFGRLVRSAGFCRLATRPHVIAQWEHVGPVISLNPLCVDSDLSADDELLAWGQDLAIIGLDLDHAGLIAALDDAAVTDEEFAAGPAAWANYANPFPAWASISDRSE